MNALIVTMYGNNNYGNRLQNYALQQYLYKIGFNDVESLKIKSLMSENLLYTILRLIKYKFFVKQIKDDRYYNFNKFNEKFIKLTRSNFHFYSNLRSYEKKYNYFIVGSDQVWNHSMTHNFNVYFLEKIDNNKKISYAASFGIDHYDKKFKKRYCKDISCFKSVSVREDRGKEIVEELTDRKDIEVLIDPTMLLTDNEWDRVAKRPLMLGNKKFILNYFLGDLSEDRVKAIEKIAKENECDIINLLDKDSPFYSCGPSEFLYLEKNAFLICTDSFHSSVFAILYNRPFVIFDREQKGVLNMNSRIDTLLSKFKLKNRKFNGKSITKENLEHDYTQAYKILDNERQKSRKFFEKALKKK